MENRGELCILAGTASALGKTDPFAITKSGPHQEHDLEPILPLGKNQWQCHPRRRRAVTSFHSSPGLPTGKRPLPLGNANPFNRSCWVTLREQSRVISHECRSWDCAQTTVSVAIGCWEKARAMW